MRSSLKTSHIVLLVILALGLAWIVPHVAAAVQRGGEAQWHRTADANVRTLNGECAATLATRVCRELCMYHTTSGALTPTGSFKCFAE